MRVLILGTHRSGTTNLTRTLGKVCNLLYVGEPWNSGLWSNETYKYPDVLKRFNLNNSINSKKSYGGTSFDNIKKMIIKYKKQLW